MECCKPPLLVYASVYEYPYRDESVSTAVCRGDHVHVHADMLMLRILTLWVVSYLTTAPHRKCLRKRYKTSPLLTPLLVGQVIGVYEKNLFGFSKNEENNWYLLRSDRPRTVSHGPTAPSMRLQAEGCLDADVLHWCSASFRYRWWCSAYGIFRTV